MKKGLLIMVVAGLVFSSQAYAKNHDKGERDGRGIIRGLQLGKVRNWFGNNDSSQFVVVGTVQSVGTNSFVVSARWFANVQNVTNGQVTINVDSNTKFTGTDSLSSATVGKSVVAIGNPSTNLLATRVSIMGVKPDVPVPQKKAKAMGEVTAKTDNSITVKNSLTGDTKTITTDANTKVSINGEAKTVADVKVGDSGWVKFKTVGSTFVAKIVNLFR
jgi:hypothetical protein